MPTRLQSFFGGVGSVANDTLHTYRVVSSPVKKLSKQNKNCTHVYIFAGCQHANCTRLICARTWNCLDLCWPCRKRELLFQWPTARQEKVGYRYAWHTPFSVSRHCWGISSSSLRRSESVWHFSNCAIFNPRFTFDVLNFSTNPSPSSNVVSASCCSQQNVQRNQSFKLFCCLHPVIDVSVDESGRIFVTEACALSP